GRRVRPSLPQAATEPWTGRDGPRQARGARPQRGSPDGVRRGANSREGVSLSDESLLAVAEEKFGWIALDLDRDAVQRLRQQAYLCDHRAELVEAAAGEVVDRLPVLPDQPVQAVGGSVEARRQVLHLLDRLVYRDDKLPSAAAQIAGEILDFHRGLVDLRDGAVH